jgi:APA family basic amino acid/polyamine antiporter
MVTSAATIFHLRKKTESLNQTGIYQMRFFPIATVFFIFVYTCIALYILFNTPLLAFTGLGVLFTFIVLYFILYSKKNKSEERMV